MKSFLHVALAATAVLSPCAQARAEPPTGYTLAWRDEFRRFSIGHWYENKKWAPFWVRYAVRHLEGNADEAVKVADFETLADGRKAGSAIRQAGQCVGTLGCMHEVSNGTLKLRGYRVPQAYRSAFWGFPYAAGMISGEMSHWQRYGYWETRVRLPNVSKGHHIAVWLLPKDGSWPPEIDMLEVVGQDPGLFHANGHGAPNGPPINSYRAPNGAGGWHVFGFLWTPDTMRWTVNDKTVREQANYIDKDLYFLISWEIGSRWPGDPDGSTKWPALAEVDYVRIYTPPPVIVP